MAAVWVVAVGLFGVALGLSAHSGISSARPSLLRWSLLRHRSIWAAGMPALALAGLVGLPYAYVHVGSSGAAPPLTFHDLEPRATAGAARAEPATSGSAGPSPAAAGEIAAPAVGSLPDQRSPGAREPGPFDGTWRVGAGSQAGYSVDDTVMGQTSRVVGRTALVRGTATVAATTVTAATIEVDMASVMCNCIHDTKYRDLLDTDVYPTSTFRLTKPMQVGVPSPGTVVVIPVTGDFTIHGVTRAVTFTLKATQVDQRVAINGSIPVNLRDYNIDDSNSQFGGLSNCEIDLLIAFDHAGR